MAITKINTPELLDINTTGAKQLPSGTTAQRPTTGVTAGDFRYNTTLNYVEYYDGTSPYDAAKWFQIDYEAAAATCTTDTINYPVAITAYYKMADATDQTGNYNGTATSVDFNVQGKFGNAGEFNGSSSFVLLPAGINTNNNFSWSFWINFTAMTQYDTPIGFFMNGFTNFIDMVSVGQLSFYDGNSRLNTPSSTFATGGWYHVAVTKSSTAGRKFYVNGSEVASDSVNTNSGSSSGGRNLFGAYSSAGNPTSTAFELNGKLDQVRIFPTALTAANVTSLYNEVQCAPTIVPSQNFNANTYFGNGATQTIDAKFNEAANFNGSSSYITTGLTLPADSTMTFSFWFKWTSNQPNSGDVYLLSDLDSSAAGNRIDIRIAQSFSNQIYIDIGNGSSRDNKATGFSPAVDTWYNLVVTLNGTAVVMYINGTEEVSYTSSVAFGTAGADPIVLGRAGAFNCCNLKCSIDQLRIFNTTLPATGTASVATLYAETTTTAATLDFPVGAGCIAAYELDGNADDISGLYSGTPTDIGYTGLKFKPDFIWLKNRETGVSNCLFDSTRGAGTTNQLYSDSTNYQGQDTTLTNLVSFDTNGFTLGATVGYNVPNFNGADYVSWNWKAGGAAVQNNDGTIQGANCLVSANQDSGFSITKYTGNGTSGATFGHGLGQQVGLSIVKNVGSSTYWYVYSNLLPTNNNLYLNTSDSKQADGVMLGGNSTTVSISASSSVNTNSGSYIAYNFASVDGMSRVGSYVGTGASGNSIVTGFRPAFLMWKASSGVGSWYIFDNKRTTSNPQGQYLQANESAAEGDGTSLFNIDFLTNGFVINGTNNEVNANGGSYIFLAIAAEPTPEPVLANSFKTVTYAGNDTTQDITSLNFKPDLIWLKGKNNGNIHILTDSIRGTNSQLSSNNTNAQTAGAANVTSFNSNGFSLGDAGNTNTSGQTYVAWCWKAGGLSAINNEGSIESIVSANPAAGFSVVSWTGLGNNGQTVGHGLGTAAAPAVPELIITKVRNIAGESWYTYSEEIGNTKFLSLNSTAAAQTAQQAGYSAGSNWWNDTSPTSSVFSLGNIAEIKSHNHVAYCFHSVAGYQKIGSYTGNGNINGPTETLGFEPGFLMIKDTSSLDAWVIYDSARNTSNPRNCHLRPNSNATEYCGTPDSVNFNSNDFQVISTWDAINKLNDVYIYLAIKEN